MHKTRFDENEWWKCKAIELQEAAESHDLKHFCDGLKVVFGSRVKETVPLHSVSGEILF